MLNTFSWNLYRPATDGQLPDVLDIPLAQQWLIEVIARHDRICGEINYIFCNDEEILEVNREFLNHDYYTDIITFDYSRGRMVNGDIYISTDTVRTNAALFGQPYINEFYRVLVHGVLHLCGINDKGPGEREIMESHENNALDLLPLREE